jgi:choline-sulfatase
MGSESSSKMPNIVFILSDDQGAWALGCAGNHEIRTPNLDRLAADGIRFEHFFCVSPVCSPARASLLTGKIPSQHGVHDWIRDGNIGESSTEYLSEHRAYTDILAENGYICGISGKWHLGDSLKPQKNFTHWFVHQTGVGNYYDAPMIRNGQPVNEPGYITDVITDDALTFIEERSQDDKPFYLSVHYTAPHFPWTGDQHPQQFLDMYKDCLFESCPQEQGHPWTRLAGLNEEEARESLIGYFAAVTAMDHNIGRIMLKLDELALRDNTLICFLSDNGFNCGHHGFWGKGNGTFPLNLFDTSIKVPAIMCHPGHIPPGIVCEDLVSAYDFMPTLLDYLHLDYLHIEDSHVHALPGQSFLHALQGKQVKDDRPVVVYDEYGSARMIRTKAWKYVHRYPYGPHELYDLLNDPGEKRNLIHDASMEEIAASLKCRLDEWFILYADPKVDGVREAVAGGGQIHLAGVRSKGKNAYSDTRDRPVDVGRL